VRLYEYEAKKLFLQNKIPIPQGEVATTTQEVEAITKRLGSPVVLKVQILCGGRGKVGGIQFASEPEEAAEVAERLFRTKVMDYPVEKILVEERLMIAEEYYLGVTIDRTKYQYVIIVSSEGGVEIEDTARAYPEKIHKLYLGVGENFYPYQALLLAKRLGMEKKILTDGASIIISLFSLFKAYDAKLVEINPLVLTKNGQILAADARMNIDEDALYRHPDLKEMGIVERHEEAELTEREKWARAEGIPYLDLDGDIGMFPGGAGFGIMGNDFIHYYGGKPANFMDSGGGPTPERLAKMLKLLDENPKVKVIFGARFGGISRCDDFARGVIMFLKEHGLSKPLVLRMTGNMWREGVEIFEKAKEENPQLFEKIEIHGIETPIEEIVKRVVELEKSIESEFSAEV